MKHTIFSKKIRSVFVISAFLSLSMLNQTSQASDDKSWNGSICQAENGFSEESLQRGTGGLLNTSFYNVPVVCVLPRDNTRNLNGTQSAWVYIRARSTSTETISCSLSEVGANGLDQYDSTFSRRVGSGWLSLDTDYSRPWGTRVLRCDLPSHASLASITISEY